MTRRLDLGARKLVMLGKEDAVVQLVRVHQPCRLMASVPVVCAGEDGRDRYHDAVR